MKRIIRGRVHSAKADKTIIVRVVTRQTHPVYKKQYTRHRKYMAHDESNEAKEGDLVTISESHPISARKRFVLQKVVEKAAVGYEETDAVSDVPEELGAKSSESIAKKTAQKPSAKDSQLSAGATKGSDK